MNITTSSNSNAEGGSVHNHGGQGVVAVQPHETGHQNPVQLIAEDPNHSPGSGDDDGDFKKVPVSDTDKLKTGRRKINIEFIEDKSRRHITFSKRKAGIMKKAYELSTLTGTQVLLLVASETGHVYTFATPKLQPLITKPEGKHLIQQCLNAPEVGNVPVPQHHQPRIQGYEAPMMYPAGAADPQMEAGVYDEEKKESKSAYPLGMDMNYAAGNSYAAGSIIPGSYTSQSVPRNYAAYQYATQSQVAQYQQPTAQQYSSGAYAQTGWKQSGLQAIPMQGGQQGQQQAGMIQNKQGGEHSAEHST